MRALLPALAAAWLRGALRLPDAGRCELPVDLQNTTWSLLAQQADVLVLAEDDSDDLLNVMLYDCSRQKRLVFAHIPKNAGTTIEDIARQFGVQWGRHGTQQRYGAARQLMPDGSTCSKWHVPPEYLPEPNLYSNAEVFCVTRHPYERALSEYRWALGLVNPPQAPRLRAAQPCTPAGLNTFLQQTLRRVQQGQTFIDDCHFLPQEKFVWGRGKKWCNHILRLDAFPNNFNDLMRANGYAISLQPAQKHNSHASTCPMLTIKSFSAETKRLLNEVYAGDFRKLDYSLAKR